MLKIISIISLWMMADAFAMEQTPVEEISITEDFKKLLENEDEEQIIALITWPVFVKLSDLIKNGDVKDQSTASLISKLKGTALEYIALNDLMFLYEYNKEYVSNIIETKNELARQKKLEKKKFSEKIFGKNKNYSKINEKKENKKATLLQKEIRNIFEIWKNRCSSSEILWNYLDKKKLLSKIESEDIYKNDLEDINNRCYKKYQNFSANQLGDELFDTLAKSKLEDILAILALTPNLKVTNDLGQTPSEFAYSIGYRIFALLFHDEKIYSLFDKQKLKSHLIFHSTSENINSSILNQ